MKTRKSLLMNGDCMDVDLASDTNTTMGKFMEKVSTKLEQKKNDAKTTRKKEKANVYHLFQESECYYSARRRIQAWRCARHS